MEHGELSWRDRGRLWVRLGIRLVLLVLILMALYHLAPPLLSLFMPFVLAFIIAWLLNPLVKLLQKRLGIPRGILSLVLILLVFAVVGGVLAILFHSVFTEMRSLGENWQSVWANTQSGIRSVSDFLDSVLTYLPEEIEEAVNFNFARFALWLQQVIPTFLADLATRAGSAAMNIPSFAIASVIFVMASYFTIADYPHIGFMVTQRLSGGVKSFLQHVKKTAVGAFGGYVRAEFILSVAVFFILLVGFLLMRQGYSVLLALLLAVLDFIPIIGAGTVMIPWALIDLVTGNWIHAVCLLAVWGVIALFRRVAEPKVVGSQTGLSPLLSLVSIYVGMKLGGVLGMILGPVLCLVILNVCKCGVLDGILGDVHLAVRDTAALLKNAPPPPDKGNSGE